MPPILSAEATAEAVRLALLRQKCHAIGHGLPPYAGATAEARQVAHPLGRTMGLPAVLRVPRVVPEVRAPEEQAGRIRGVVTFAALARSPVSGDAA